MRRVLLAICSPAFPQVEFRFRGVSNDSCLGNQSTGVVFSEKWNRKCYIFILPLHHLVIQVPQVKYGAQNASPTTETVKKRKKVPTSLCFNLDLTLLFPKKLSPLLGLLVAICSGNSNLSRYLESHYRCASPVWYIHIRNILLCLRYTTITLFALSWLSCCAQVHTLRSAIRSEEMRQLYFQKFRIKRTAVCVKRGYIGPLCAEASYDFPPS